MSKAIETKFLHANNRRGSRIKAHDRDKNSILADFQYAWNPDKNRAYAAFCLVKKMGWHGFYVGGSTKTGEVFVKVAADGRFPQAAGMADHARIAHDKPYGFERQNWFYVPDPRAGENGTGKFPTLETSWERGE